MGICNTLNEIKEARDKEYKDIKNQLVDLTNTMAKSNCKIIYNINGQYNFGNGFFLKCDNKYYLLTCYHIINSNKLNINIELCSRNVIQLDLTNRNILFIPEPMDITIIELNELNFISNKEIIFLDYEFDYYEGYEKYRFRQITNIGFKIGGEISLLNGYIENINGIEFSPSFDINNELSGSPIIFNDGDRVVGIFKYQKDNLNICSFIGDAIDKLRKNNLKLIGSNKIINKNEIIAKYYLNHIDIKLLCDYNDESIFNKLNEKEKISFLEAKNQINEKNIEIYIEEKKEQFDYKYYNREKGDLFVKFILNKPLTNISYMFYCCFNLISLDLTSFNAINVKDMNHMFTHSDLRSIDLSSLNTINVKDMNNMFSFCYSLISLDLSSFNTINVNNMSYMFKDCKSLNSLKISSFNTTNVNNMSYMFSGCESLILLDLSSFNTTNVKDMSGMFSGCKSLISLDLSSFDTTNVNNFAQIFEKCESLKSDRVKIGEKANKLLDILPN